MTVEAADVMQHLTADDELSLLLKPIRVMSDSDIVAPAVAIDQIRQLSCGLKCLGQVCNRSTGIGCIVYTGALTCNS